MSRNHSLCPCRCRQDILSSDVATPSTVFEYLRSATIDIHNPVHPQTSKNVVGVQPLLRIATKISRPLLRVCVWHFKMRARQEKTSTRLEGSFCRCRPSLKQIDFS